MSDPEPVSGEVTEKTKKVGRKLYPGKCRYKLVRPSCGFNMHNQKASENIEYREPMVAQAVNPFELQAWDAASFTSFLRPAKRQSIENSEASVLKRIMCLVPFQLRRLPRMCGS